MPAVPLLPPRCVPTQGSGPSSIPLGPAGVAGHRTGAELSCTLGLTQSVGPAGFYSLLRQERAWAKLPRAGFKDLLWEHVSHRLWWRVPSP